MAKKIHINGKKASHNKLRRRFNALGQYMYDYRIIDHGGGMYEVINIKGGKSKTAWMYTVRMR
jgi:hypothetical protein